MAAVSEGIGKAGNGMPFIQGLTLGLIAVAAISLSGCYMYHDRNRALVPNIDIDQTLKVAEMELQENKLSSVLTLWAIRDQVLTGAQAAEVSAMYFDHIGRVDSEEQKSREFSVWHLTWAVSNMYRLGDVRVQRALYDAYADAGERVARLQKSIACKHFSGEKIYMGDVHAGGRAYAKSHLIVPGNGRYLQSVKQYEDDQ
jgi:hypothetical protein